MATAVESLKGKMATFGKLQVDPEEKDTASVATPKPQHKLVPAMTISGTSGGVSDVFSTVERLRSRPFSREMRMDERRVIIIGGCPDNTISRRTRASLVGVPERFQNASCSVYCVSECALEYTITAKRYNDARRV